MDHVQKTHIRVGTSEVRLSIVTSIVVKIVDVEEAVFCVHVLLQRVEVVVGGRAWELFKVPAIGVDLRVVSHIVLFIVISVQLRRRKDIDIRQHSPIHEVNHVFAQRPCPVLGALTRQLSTHRTTPRVRHASATIIQLILEVSDHTSCVVIGAFEGIVLELIELISWNWIIDDVHTHDRDTLTNHVTVQTLSSSVTGGAEGPTVADELSSDVLFSNLQRVVGRLIIVT